jgi:hypothetical protein
MKVNIYCLYDPVTCKIRYIGRTRKSIDVRLIEHISKSRYYHKYFPDKRPPHKVNWIKSLLEKGYEPKIKKLTEVDGWNESYVFETNLIGKYKDKFDLLNAQDRGTGPESRITSDLTKSLISNTLKEKYKKNEIKKKTTKIYIFNSSGILSHVEESITSASIYFNVHRRGIDSRIKSKKSIDGMFLSKSDTLNLNDYLYLYNYNSKEIKIFSTFLEIMKFLNITEFVYKKLDKNKKPFNEWIINSLKPNLERKTITLYKDGIEYNFDSVKDAAKHIGCLVYSIYDLLRGTTKSLYNYKTTNI